MSFGLQESICVPNRFEIDRNSNPHFNFMTHAQTPPLGEQIHRLLQHVTAAARRAILRGKAPLLESQPFRRSSTPPSRNAQREMGVNGKKGPRTAPPKKTTPSTAPCHHFPLTPAHANLSPRSRCSSLKPILSATAIENINVWASLCFCSAFAR